jgi:hypothetical protein
MDNTTQKRKIDWWIFSIPILLIITILFYFKVQSRPGFSGVLIFYFAPFFISFLSIIFIVIGIIRSFIKRPFFTRWRIVGFLLLILLCFSGIIYNTYPSSYDEKPSKVKFRLPLDTIITVAWGGATEKINYHKMAPEQCWAYDLIVAHNKKSYTGDSSKIENYYCYGLPIISPANGKVVNVVNNIPDIPIGDTGNGEFPEGNFIVIEVEKNEFLFICHMKPNSIKVKIGDVVTQGQSLGQVGNSGNTSEPHIHIHLQDRNDAIGEGIPLYFHNYIVDGKLVEKGIPTGGFDDKQNFIGQTVQNVKE